MRWRLAAVAFLVFPVTCSPSGTGRDVTSQPAVRSTAPTIESSTATVLAEVIPVTAASMGPGAPVDTGAPLTSHAVDSDDVVLITDAMLIPALVEALRVSTAELLEPVDASSPYWIEVLADGGTCSAGKANPTPMSSNELPALVEATR